MTAYTAHNLDAYVVLMAPGQDIRLPNLLQHIEAGKTVLLMPAPPVQP